MSVFICTLLNFLILFMSCKIPSKVNELSNETLSVHHDKVDTCDNSLKTHKKTPFRVGLTGGIACGKSGIASLFAKLNVPIVDTDVIAREVVMPGTALLGKLSYRFGHNIIKDDGSLDRRLLRQIAFDKSHPENLNDLNALMAPAIEAETVRQVQEKDAPYVIICIPLLFEHHLEYMVDRILVVDVEPKLQLERLISRDGINRELALSMIASQVDRETRLKKAHDLIESDSSPLDKKGDLVLKLHNLYQQLANSKI